MSQYLQHLPALVLTHRVLILCLGSGPRSQDPSLKRNGVKVPGEHRRKENGVSDGFPVF